MSPIPLLFLKSLVPAHTRRLKSGKVVRVRQYSNKVNKHPDGDDQTLDMFADDVESRKDLGMPRPTHEPASKMRGRPDMNQEAPQKASSQHGSAMGSVSTGHVAASQQIAQAILDDGDDYATYALRVIPGEYEGEINVGQVLPPSNQWIDGDDTGEPLSGTSAIKIDGNDESAVQRAIRLLGAHGKPGPNGFYFGDTVVLVKGDQSSSGEDYGEVLLTGAEIVGIWKKPTKGNSEVQPNKISVDDVVTEPRQEMIDEHKRLVDVLESPSHKDDKVEAKKQAEELREYEGESTNDDERLHQLIARAKALGAQGGAPGIAATLKGYIGGKNPAGVVISRSEGIAALEGMLATAEVKAKPAPKVVSVKGTAPDETELASTWSRLQERDRQMFLLAAHPSMGALNGKPNAKAMKFAQGDWSAIPSEVKAGLGKYMQMASSDIRFKDRKREQARLEREKVEQAANARKEEIKAAPDYSPHAKEQVIGGIRFQAVLTDRPHRHWRLKNMDTGKVFPSGTGGVTADSKPHLWAKLVEVLNDYRKHSSEDDFRRWFQQGGE